MAIDINKEYGNYPRTYAKKIVKKHPRDAFVSSDAEKKDKANESEYTPIFEERDSIQISVQGRAALRARQEEDTVEGSQTFKTVDDLSKYLYENFDIVKGGMAEISSKYLKECLQDEDKRQRLFENLKAASEAIKEKQGTVGFQSMKIKIDSDGEVTMESSKKTVTVNEGKRKRQIAAAATKGDMQAIVALLEQDLQEVEAGLKENACDEAEVEKVKALLAEAKQMMSSLPDRASTPEEQSIMMMNTLM